MACSTFDENPVLSFWRQVVIANFTLDLAAIFVKSEVWSPQNITPRTRHLKLNSFTLFAKIVMSFRWHWSREKQNEAFFWLQSVADLRRLL
jgi:hypothetical protein